MKMKGESSAMKEQGKRNRTICLSPSEEEEYANRCSSVLPHSYLQEQGDLFLRGDFFHLSPDLPKNFVDLLVVDPPYNLRKQYSSLCFQKQSNEDYETWTEQWVSLVKPTLKESASLYVCCDWRSSLVIGRVLERHFTIQNRITWQREKGRGAKNNWKNGMEDIWFATVSPKNYYFQVNNVKLRRRVLAPYKVNGKPKDWEKTSEGNFRDTHPSNFWDDISIPYWSMPENTKHPTQKPEKLLAKLILASSCEGDLVFDPFSGSGTTAVVAKKLGRRYLSIELATEYCAYGQKRLELAESHPEIQGYQDGIFWERNTSVFQKKKSTP